MALSTICKNGFLFKYIRYTAISQLKTIFSGGRDVWNQNRRTAYLAQASYTVATSANSSRSAGFVWSGLARLRILKNFLGNRA